MAVNGSDDDRTKSFTALTTGVVVSHYKIISKIGAGGMGEVHLAEDTELNRKVALKFLPQHLCQDEDCRARFKREAQAAAALKHANIITIYEVSEFNGRPFMVMEYVEGKSLRDKIKEKSLTINDATNLTMQICAGLNEAHESGIVHRDLKPANILLDKNNQPIILDFGLATIKGTEKITKTGLTLGTVGYLSPEQARGEKVDKRSDLFSVGVILYEMITGKQPFYHEYEAATMNAILHEDPEPIARFKSGTTAELQQIIDKALSKDVSIRYQTAAGMLADLKRLKSDSIPQKKSRLILWAAGAVVLIAVIALLLWQYWREKHITDAVPMIAVLPFDNLGPPEDEYFADGMTEEITSRLAGIHGLGVISRTSAIKFKNSDKQLSEIGKELGVSYILEGTVRWSKEGELSRVRITPQLICVSDDRHLWADNYERELIEIFALQADIASQIVEQLGITLLEEDKSTLAIIPTTNTEAYQLYLKAINSFRRDEDDPGSRKDIDSVIALDSAFALAFALRSEIYSRFALGEPKSNAAYISLESAEKSLELQPGLPQGYLALGHYYHYVETDYDRAMEQFSLAESRLKNNPDLFDAISLVHLRRGDVDQAVNYRRKAVDLDPLNARRHGDLSQWFRYAQRYDEALQASNRAIALEPNEPIYWHKKIATLESWYGEVDSIIPIAIEALKHCDSLEFAKLDWNRGQYLSILPWDSLGAEYARAILEEDPDDYRRIYISCYKMGNLELTVTSADSAKEQYRKSLEESPDFAGYHSYSGLRLSFLGECDTAIALGLQGKELMSPDECFC